MEGLHRAGGPEIKHNFATAANPVGIKAAFRFAERSLTIGSLLTLARMEMC
jgi:hypothetical protein